MIDSATTDPSRRMFVELTDDDVAQYRTAAIPASASASSLSSARGTGAGELSPSPTQVDPASGRSAVDRPSKNALFFDYSNFSGGQMSPAGPAMNTLEPVLCTPTRSPTEGVSSLISAVPVSAIPSLVSTSALSAIISPMYLDTSSVAETAYRGPALWYDSGTVARGSSDRLSHSPASARASREHILAAASSTAPSVMSKNALFHADFSAETIRADLNRKPGQSALPSPSSSTAQAAPIQGRTNNDALEFIIQKVLPDASNDDAQRFLREPFDFLESTQSTSEPSSATSADDHHTWPLVLFPTRKNFLGEGRFAMVCHFEFLSLLCSSV